MKVIAGLFAALLAAQPLAAQDQAAADAKPGAPEADSATVAIAASDLPGLVPTKAFAGRSKFGDLTLSPKGSKIAHTEMLEATRASDGATKDKEFVLIRDAATREQIRLIAVPSGHRIRFLRWAGDERLLMSFLFYDKRYGFPVTRLLVHDVAENRTSFVGRLKQGLFGDDVIYVDPHGRYLLLSFKKTMSRDAEVYRVLLDGSEFEETAVKIQSTKGGADTWWADNAGVVRLGMHFNGSKRQVWYRSGPDEDWDKVAKFRTYDDDAKYWQVLNITEGSDTGLVFAKGDGGFTAIREFDFKTGELGRIVYEQPGADVETVTFDDDNRLVKATYLDDRERNHWFDDEMRGWQTMLEEALPDSNIFVTHRSDGNERMIVYNGSEADPGAYFIFTPAEKKLELWRQARPDLDFNQLARSKPVTYTARDDTPIRAYLTLPGGVEPSNLPLIILPHGGPYGVRDSLQYNDEVQLLANRGYAVLQPNFRGSGGYGDAFEELGYGQIGRAMQDDLDDAMDWAVREGIVDPARVCLVGASYGGFAAMYGVIRNPERYRCAASWAGVTDFVRILRHDKDYLGRRGSKRLRAKLEGFDQEQELRDFSPVDYGERLTRPLLLAHGERDERVPLRQYKKMADKSKDAPGFETLLLEKSGHGFASPEDEQAWYDRLLAFLAKHNPSDRNPAPDVASAAQAAPELAEAD